MICIFYVLFFLFVTPGNVMLFLAYLGRPKANLLSARSTFSESTSCEGQVYIVYILYYNKVNMIVIPLYIYRDSYNIIEYNII